MKVTVLLAEGFEEIEALTVVDLLRRAKIEAVTAAVGGKVQVTGRSGITVAADCLIEECDFSDAAMIVLPGGMPGVTNLAADALTMEKVREFAQSGDRYVAAICAGPTILGDAGLLKGHEAVCYPGMEGRLAGASVPEGAKSAVSGNIITSRGLGTAIDFSLRIIEKLSGADAAQKVADGIVYAG